MQEEKVLFLRSAGSGFSLIELLVVVAVIAIVASIAVPNYTQSTKAANEGAAIAHLRTVSSAQALYHARYGSYADRHDQLAAEGLLAVSAANTGYLISVAATGDGWYAQASPESPGVTGDRYFYIGEDGVIRWSIGSPPTSSAPALGAGRDGSAVIEDHG